MNTRRFLLAGLLALASVPALAADKVHHLALQISDDTPEKCTTMARTSIWCSRCKPSMATAVESELASATSEAKLPSAK